MFIIYSGQTQIPENFMPVFFDIGHLMKWDVQSLTHCVGVLAVSLSGAHPSLIQRVPVPHKHSCHTVAFSWKRRHQHVTETAHLVTDKERVLHFTKINT